MHKHYYSFIKTILLLILSFSANATEKLYTLQDVQGTWWGSCDDEVAVFYIQGDMYSGDFLGTFNVELSKNKLLFKSGLPEGHSINVDGEPQTYLLLSATKGKLKLQDVEDDTFSFNLFSCE